MAGDTQESSSTTTTKSQPYANDLLGWGKSIVNSGDAWKPDTTSHVVPFSTQTTDAMKGLTDAAKSGQNYANENFFRVAGQLRDGGLNNLQDQQVGRLQSIANAPIAQGGCAQRCPAARALRLPGPRQPDATAGYRGTERYPAAEPGRLQGMAINTPGRAGFAALNDVQRNAMNLLTRSPAARSSPATRISRT